MPRKCLDLRAHHTPCIGALARPPFTAPHTLRMHTCLKAAAHAPYGGLPPSPPSHKLPAPAAWGHRFCLPGSPCCSGDVVGASPFLHHTHTHTHTHMCLCVHTTTQTTLQNVATFESPQICSKTPFIIIRVQKHTHSISPRTIFRLHR